MTKNNSNPSLSGTKTAPKKRDAHNVVDRVGQRFGKLVVLGRAGSKGTAATWLCLCDCGQQKIVSSNALRGNYTKSCGCSRKTGKGSRPEYACALPPGLSARNTVLKNYKQAARRRGHAWGLSDSEFDAITASNCAYCGQPPSNVSKPSRNGLFVFSGIDRIDNRRGYLADNVVPCCSVCNHAKHDMSAEDFTAWIRRLASHWSIGDVLTTPAATNKQNRRGHHATSKAK